MIVDARSSTRDAVCGRPRARSSGDVAARRHASVGDIIISTHNFSHVTPSRGKAIKIYAPWYIARCNAITRRTRLWFSGKIFVSHTSFSYFRRDKALTKVPGSIPGGVSVSIRYDRRYTRRRQTPICHSHTDDDDALVSTIQRILLIIHAYAISSHIKCIFLPPCVRFFSRRATILGVRVGSKSASRGFDQACHHATRMHRRRREYIHGARATMTLTFDILQSATGRRKL